jgi:hypothetical protein
MDQQAGPSGGPAGESSAADSAAKDSSAADSPAEDSPAEDSSAGVETATGDPVGQPTASDTGEQRVDDALQLLDQLAELPVTEHAAVFERVHARLTDVLGELDPESAGTDG